MGVQDTTQASLPKPPSSERAAGALHEFYTLWPHTGSREWRARIEKLQPLAPILHSLHHADLPTSSGEPDPPASQLNTTLGDDEIKTAPIQVKFELLEKDDFVHIVRIAAPGTANLLDGSQLKSGTLVDVEKYINSPLAGWDNVKEQTENLHVRSKEIFFQRLLTPEAIQFFDPEY